MRIASLALLVLSAAGCHYRDQEPQPPPVFVPPPPDRAPALEAEIARLQLELVARESRIQEVSVGEANLTQQVEDLSQVNIEMSERLRLSSESLEQLAAERGRLALELEEAKTKLGDRKETKGDTGTPNVMPMLPPAPDSASENDDSEELVSELVSDDE